ncbi:hypothetical protein RHGRI_031262 [Rhododendron griersonianum]|uniref:Cytochrome b561 domain-containing protein n=1 Tax=Rhododendron griersonianum TaxID=479676 RepID=A0AAV6I7Q9_9ERIC|nr:hypothetical protein RHGRI_031262 [Rhododendron griersonianum]
MVFMMAHGVLNAVSWGIMMPLGFMAARYLKAFGPRADPLWFYTHVSLQLSGYFLGMSGGATGLVLGNFCSIYATCEGPQAQTYLELVPPSHRLLSSSLELGQHMGRLHHFEACKVMDDRVWFYLWCSHAYLADFRSLEEDDKRWNDQWSTSQCNSHKCRKQSLDHDCLLI